MEVTAATFETDGGPAGVDSPFDISSLGTSLDAINGAQNTVAATSANPGGYTTDVIIPNNPASLNQSITVTFPIDDGTGPVPTDVVLEYWICEPADVFEVSYESPTGTGTANNFDEPTTLSVAPGDTVLFTLNPEAQGTYVNSYYTFNNGIDGSSVGSTTDSSSPQSVNIPSDATAGDTYTISFTLVTGQTVTFTVEVV